MVLVQVLPVEEHTASCGPMRPFAARVDDLGPRAGCRVQGLQGHAYPHRGHVRRAEQGARKRACCTASQRWRRRRTPRVRNLG